MTNPTDRTRAERVRARLHRKPLAWTIADSREFRALLARHPGLVFAGLLVIFTVLSLVLKYG